MKRASHWLVMCLLSLMIHAISSAKNPDSQLLFSITANNTARLGIVNTSRKNIDLKIINDKGMQIYNKSVAGEQNFFQVLSLDNMPDGEYKVTLSDQREIGSKYFLIKNSTACILKEEAPSFYLRNNNTLIISYLNTLDNTVNVFFMRNGEVVFEDRGLSGMGLSKQYSLDKLPKGEYEIKLYSASMIYTHPLVINK